MFFDSILNFKLIVMSEKKVSGKVLMFTGIVIIVFLVAIFGFIFWEPVPEIIQGEAEATEVRISGKVPGRIERFLVDEGDQVKKGDTVAILDSPEVMAKFNQAQAAEEAAQAMSDKAQKGAREEQKAMAFQTWKKAQAALDVAKKSFDRVQKLYENDVVSAQKRDEAEANYKAMLATEQAAKAQYEMAKNGAEKEDKLAAEAQVNRARGAVEEVSSYIKETFLISPISGEISERYPKVGELVGTGSPVMSVLDLEDMWVVFNVREDLLGDLKMGAVFTGYIPALNNSGTYALAGGVVDPLPEDAPQFVKDYYAYYKTPRGYHPRSLNSNGGWNVTSSLSFLNMPILQYSSEIRSAVLLVHGEKAHSRYFSETAYSKLTGDNKELLIIPGASHTDLYDQMDVIPFEKLEAFFSEHLR